MGGLTGSSGPAEYLSSVMLPRLWPTMAAWRWYKRVVQSHHHHRPGNQGFLRLSGQSAAYPSDSATFSPIQRHGTIVCAIATQTPPQGNCVSSQPQNDHILSVIVSPDGQQSVLIVQRPDGSFSYRRQWLASARTNDPDSPIVTASEVSGEAWGPPGPYCGIYDSAETAANEAFSCVPWLNRAETAVHGQDRQLMSGRKISPRRSRKP